MRHIDTCTQCTPYTSKSSCKLQLPYKKKIIYIFNKEGLKNRYNRNKDVIRRKGQPLQRNGDFLVKSYKYM